eukprot:scaffold40277_cov39-Cyclotella_meneghiniana.AAC.1
MNGALRRVPDRTMHHAHRSGYGTCGVEHPDKLCDLRLFRGCLMLQYTEGSTFSWYAYFPSHQKY